MKADGDRMFRSIAHQLHGLEEKHQQVRQVIQVTIETKKEWYRCLWMGNRCLEEHINDIKIVESGKHKWKYRLPVIFLVPLYALEF